MSMFLLFNKVKAGAGASENWWEAGGAIGCLQALQPKGSDDYASSLTDLTGNGNDASEGVSPDWDATNGWKFNGVDDYLQTGITPVAGYTMLIQFTNNTANVPFVGSNDLGELAYFRIGRGEGANVMYAAYGDTEASNAPKMTAGNYAIAGNTAYRDGATEGSIGGTWLGTAIEIYIGTWNSDESEYAALYVQSFAIYDNILSAAKVSAVATAMGAL